MIYNNLKLSNQICFPLYACSRIVVKLYKPFLDPLGLTYTQYITLMALWEEDSVSVKSLGDILFLDSGTLTPLLKKLEIQGFVKRERSQIDERSVLINLTKKGVELKHKAADIPLKMASCIDIPQNDAIELHRILNKIMSNENNARCKYM